MCIISSSTPNMLSGSMSNGGSQSDHDGQRVLKVAIAIRLEDYSDKIEGMLLLALAEPNKGPENSSNLQDPLETSKWEASKTLITLVQCKSLWNQFQKETEYVETDINKKDKNKAKTDKTEHGMERA
ncbi:root hair defective 3-like protein [Tanacetum coccineum]